MWLLRAFPSLASFASRVFYRLETSGARVPRQGPVLLVANHPNALLDPLLAVAAARRPVRFVAKSTLFTDAVVGWGMRAVGAIPVYRRKDDPDQTARNEEMFRAVVDALDEGAAVGIFPEGISHDNPTLAPLKTGAARIALLAAQRLGGPFPIMPVGLVFEAKQEFRSRAHALVGHPVEWSDLAKAGVINTDSVRELTTRIEGALHDVTVNYQRREDARVVAAATAIYTAEFAKAVEPEERLALRRSTARRLAELHAEGDPDATALSRAIQRHQRALAILGLTPDDVHRRTDVTAAFKWTLRRLSPAAVLTAVVAALGFAVFWIPYRLTGIAAGRTATARDSVAMHKLLLGSGIFAAWIIALAVGAGLAAGWWAAMLAVVVLPALALATISYGERWVDALRDVRSFFVLRTRSFALQALRARQRGLAERLAALYTRSGSGHRTAVKLDSGRMLS